MDNFDKISFATALILATQATRLIPLIFREQLEKLLNFGFIKNHLGDLIIFCLIIYCYRDFSFTNEYLLRLTVGMVVFTVQWVKGNSLMSIFLGTALYMGARIFI